MAEDFYISEARLEERFRNGLRIGEERGRNEGLQIGEQRGRNEGYASANRETVLRMYNQQFPIDMIARAVDMSNHEVYEIVGSNVIA